MPYPFAEIEPKWQQYWDDHSDISHAERLPDRPKMYILDMYPVSLRRRAARRTSRGIHCDGYSLPLQTDERVHVLHPMGWDAFGLPAERYAMQTNIHPRITTEQNIATFRRQIKMLGLSYDWAREIDTTDPGVLQMDAVDFPQDLQFVVRSARRQGASD